ANQFQAVYLGRLALGLLCALLLGAAAWILGRRPSPWPLCGLLAAVTPMVLFVASGIATSGIESCACVCFGAALLALDRAGAPAAARPGRARPPRRAARPTPGRPADRCLRMARHAPSGGVLPGLDGARRRAGGGCPRAGALARSAGDPADPVLRAAGRRRDP